LCPLYKEPVPSTWFPVIMVNQTHQVLHFIHQDAFHILTPPGWKCFLCVHCIYLYVYMWYKCYFNFMIIYPVVLKTFYLNNKVLRNNNFNTGMLCSSDVYNNVHYFAPTGLLQLAIYVFFFDFKYLLTDGFLTYMYTSNCY